jgi:hypothetical protein
MMIHFKQDSVTVVGISSVRASAAAVKGRIVNLVLGCFIITNNGARFTILQL